MLCGIQGADGFQDRPPVAALRMGEGKWDEAGARNFFRFPGLEGEKYFARWQKGASVAGRREGRIVWGPMRHRSWYNAGSK